MNKKIVKGLYTGLFSLVSLVYILLIGSLLLRKLLIQPIDTHTNRLLQPISPYYLVATILFIISTLIGFINSLSLPPTSRNEVEKIVEDIIEEKLSEKIKHMISKKQRS